MLSICVWIALALARTKCLLEDQTGQRIYGFRAPSFSVMPQKAWAIDALDGADFVYDASIFPVRHHWYGVPGAPDRPYWVQGCRHGPKMLKVPPLTWSTLERKWAVAGGGYFRLLPPWLIKRGLRQAQRQQRPAILYFHPWEFDPELPRMPLSMLGRMRTYCGPTHAADRLESIMAEPARWSAVAEVLDELRTQADSTGAFALSAE